MAGIGVSFCPDGCGTWCLVDDAGMGADRLSAFGDQLRRHRRAAGLTQEELAARAGLSVRAVADMERGRTARPYRRSVALLAEALGLSATDAARLRQSSRASVSSAGSAGEHEPPGQDQLPVATQVAPRQLPAGVGRFVGRAAELGRLDALLGDAAFRGIGES